jgi:hypothetical protein
MADGRFPKEAIRYQPKGRRDPGWPRRRWLEKPEQAVAQSLKDEDDDDDGGGGGDGDDDDDDLFLL